ncbi:MAG TPA: long-chain fatty acid--CoA ligase [Verrucomicrobiae bacterium]|nr:long-chain fatty acid--CoA ligase [Verrucomicrobiae bacterium]
MNLAQAFADSAAKYAEKPAIFWGEEVVPYCRIWRESQWLARHLESTFQVRPGEPVAIWLKNCPEFVSALFGILLSGAVVVPINNFLKPDEVTYILRDSGATVLITDAEMRESVASLRENVPALRVFEVEGLKEEDSNPAGGIHSRTAQSEKDLAVIIYTSGTTGRPKGAMLSHGNLLHNVESCRQVLQAVSFDRFVVLLPMFHSFMLTVGILLPICLGGSLVVVKSVHPPKNIFLEIVKNQATILPAIPQLFRTLSNTQLPPNFPLRLCISGAAPLPVEVLREFNSRFPIPLLEGYGLSEASPVVTMNPIQGPWKEGSIGLPIPGVAVTIQDDSGKMLAPREIGELCVRGGNVMIGYLNQPEETAQTIRGEWLLTGDVGYKDEDGYIYITDRKKDMLLVNGINVYPREVEEVIYQYAGIKEAAVVSRPDSRKGEQPVAFVVPNDDTEINERALVQFLRTKLADYKVPRQVNLLPALPRNATGKVLKTTLREMARARPDDNGESNA